MLGLVQPEFTTRKKAAINFGKVSISNQEVFESYILQTPRFFFQVLMINQIFFNDYQVVDNLTYLGVVSDFCSKCETHTTHHNSKLPWSPLWRVRPESPAHHQEAFFHAIMTEIAEVFPPWCYFRGKKSNKVRMFFYSPNSIWKGGVFTVNGGMCKERRCNWCRI